jgi:peptide/nickel transport system substrate-binding protein
MPSADNGGISDDGTTITFTLRDDIVWSDGEPITSADFVFTYEMYIAEGNIPNTRYPYDPELGIIESIEATDATTVVVTFAQPFAAWQASLWNPGVLPEHVLRPVFEAEGSLDAAEWNRNPTVGSGPFVLSEWEIGSFMRFVRNENYFDGPVNLDQIIILFAPDSEALLATLINGDADMATFIAYNDVPALEDAGLVPQIVNSGYNEQWLVNLREGLGHPALQDVRVREALFRAVNPQQITDDLLLGLTYPAASFWEGTPYASPNVEPPGYDPELANQLLDDAGWVDSDGDGTRDMDIEGENVELVLRYVTNTRQIRVDVQAVFQQQLAAVGIGVELQNFPSDIFFSGFADGGPVSLGEYDIAEYSTTSAFPDPDTTQFLCDQIPSEESPDGLNDRGYCNPEVDALFALQSQTTDPAERVAIFYQIDEIIASEFVFLGIWYDPDLWVYSSRLENVRISGADPLWNVAEWTVTD